MNWPAMIVASFVPMVIGFIWYNPKTPMGAIWVKETGITDEKMKNSNMAVIMGLSIFFCLVMTIMIVSHEVVHQWGAFSLLNKHPEEAQKILTTYADEFRTFGHGALHGTFLGICLIFPVFATNGMFELRSWKLILINSAYWTISLAIMGGIISAWY